MALYSTYWYRVAAIRPRLRSHILLHRHTYRGSNWYILQDPSANRQHRFNKTAYSIIALMDGSRTLEEIWNTITSSLGDDTPTQDEIIHLLGRLHAADLLQSDIPPNTLEMIDRQDRQRSKWKQRLNNPFALRFPLIDPDQFLAKWMPLVKPLANRATILLWFLTVGSALLLAILNWPDLTHNLADKVLTPKNLFLLWLIYPLLKLMHELSHAFVTRIWGGEVHEMGIMLLALTPIPYVEASASTAFPEKEKRMAVAAAGMAMELLVASLALFLWLSVESGLISAIAYNIMLIGSLSTLLFNGNPLLRFDGYYILADWIEIPNLASRSSRYLGYLLQRYLFGIEEATSPVTAPGERPWFICYGIASFLYRMSILTTLALFVSSKFFFIGILIALWAVCSQLIVPAIRHSYNFYNSSGGRRKRTRIIASSLSIAVTTMILFFIVPVPLRTSAQGVVSLPEYSQIRAGTDCFLTEILVQDETMIQKGDALLRCTDPFLESEVRILAANHEEALARYHAVPLQSRVRRELLKEEVFSTRAELDRAQERRHELTIRSPKQGLLVLPDVHKLPGRFVKQGTLLGYVIGASEPAAIVVVSQWDIALVRERTRSVELRLASHLDLPLPATINREIPAASYSLPSTILGSSGGGNIPVNPADPDGIQTLSKTFQLELHLPIQKEAIRVGERAYALFDHGHEPLALQWYRTLRQLFLRQFHV